MSGLPGQGVIIQMKLPHLVLDDQLVILQHDDPACCLSQVMDAWAMCMVNTGTLMRRSSKHTMQYSFSGLARTRTIDLLKYISHCLFFPSGIPLECQLCRSKELNQLETTTQSWASLVWDSGESPAW